MQFNVVLSELIHPCSKKWKRVNFSIRRVDTAVCVRALQMCVRERGKLLTQRVTVPPTIPSVLYARLVPLGSPYIES